MEEFKSKSQKKRDAESLQKLGVALTKLSNDQIKQVGLPEKLEQAIFEAKRIKSNGALRRHCQYIGRIMREVDVEPIQQAYDEITQATAASNADFHLCERWRERLMNDGSSALTQFIDEYGVTAEVQQLRQLINKAINERERQKNLGASKALFRLIKELMSWITHSLSAALEA